MKRRRNKGAWLDFLKFELAPLSCWPGESFTAKAAEAAKEQKSLTAKDAEDAKDSIPCAGATPECRSGQLDWPLFRFIAFTNASLLAHLRQILWLYILARTTPHDALACFS